MRWTITMACSLRVVGPVWLVGPGFVGPGRLVAPGVTAGAMSSGAHRRIGGLAPVDAWQYREGAAIDFREIFDGAEPRERGHFGHAQTGLPCKVIGAPARLRTSRYSA